MSARILWKSLGNRQWYVLSSIALTSQSSQQAQHLAASLQHSKTSSDEAVPKVTDVAFALALFAWYPYQPNGSSTHITTESMGSSDIVQCRICRRRVGLWQFARDKSQVRPFDLVNEHVKWCPMRPDYGGEWWNDAGPLKPKEGGARKQGVGWIKLSSKLERKSWRR